LWKKKFDKELPEYRTHGGVHIQEKRVTAPPIMWVKALDMLMEKLRIVGVDFSRVKAISGAGQVSIVQKKIFIIIFIKCVKLYFSSNMEVYIGGQELMRFWPHSSLKNFSMTSLLMPLLCLTLLCGWILQHMINAKP